MLLMLPHFLYYGIKAPTDLDSDSAVKTPNKKTSEALLALLRAVENSAQSISDVRLGVPITVLATTPR